MKKEWWKTFFGSHAKKVMFDLKSHPTKKEIHQILKKTKVLPNAHILDLACGIGRHSFEFAKLGFQVSGLDYSKEYIQLARSEALRQNVSRSISFTQGDMRDLKRHYRRKQFDLITSLFNSFGYFDKRSDDECVIKEVASILKPGGKFVLNTLNRMAVERRLCEIPPTANLDGFYVWKETKKNLFTLDKAVYDKKTRRTVCEWVLIDLSKNRKKSNSP